MDLLFDPDGFMRRGVSWKLSIAVLAISAILSTIAVSFIAPYIVEEMKEKMLAYTDEKTAEAMAKGTYATMLVSPAVGVVILWGIYAVLTYVAASLLGGSGKFSHLAKLAALSFVPSIVLSPFSIYLSYETATLVAKIGIKAIATFRTPELLLSVASNLWGYVYLLFAAKNAMELTTKRAAIAAAVPFALMYSLKILGMAISPSSATL